MTESSNPLARRSRGGSTDSHNPVSARDFADAQNAGLSRRGVEWFVRSDGGLSMRWTITEEQKLWKRDRVLPDDVSSVNFGLRHAGSSMRFTTDGFPYQLETGDRDPAPSEFPWHDRDRTMSRRDRENRALMER